MNNMRFDISDLLKNKAASVDFSIKVDGSLFQEYIEDKSVNLTDELSFEGTLVNNKSVLLLKGKLNFEYFFHCARCDKAQKSEIASDVEQSFTQSSNNSIDDTDYTYSGNYIDLTELIKDEILLAVPVKHLCNESCKGLCHVCGKNLNDTKCSCNNENFDSRLSALADFFKDEK